MSAKPIEGVVKVVDEKDLETWTYRGWRLLRSIGELQFKEIVEGKK